MDKSILEVNTATLCEKFTILAVNHVSMLKQYVSVFKYQPRSLVAEWAKTPASGNLFVVGSNPAIGPVKFLLGLELVLGLGIVFIFMFFFHLPPLRRNSKFPGVVRQYLRPE